MKKNYKGWKKKFVNFLIRKFTKMTFWLQRKLNVEIKIRADICSYGEYISTLRTVVFANKCAKTTPASQNVSHAFWTSIEIAMEMAIRVSMPLNSFQILEEELKKGLPLCEKTREVIEETERRLLKIPVNARTSPHEKARWRSAELRRSKEGVIYSF